MALFQGLQADQVVGGGVRHVLVEAAQHRDPQPHRDHAAMARPNTTYMRADAAARAGADDRADGAGERAAGASSGSKSLRAERRDEPNPIGSVDQAISWFSAKTRPWKRCGTLTWTIVV